jgi:MSHA pilin protein MshB
MGKQKGFTLIELVIVVVILGLLAVTAIPKFVDLTEQAKQANIEGMAGGFATAVSLVRSQWEAEGRPNDGTKNVVTYDGTALVLTEEDFDNGISPGYPTGLTDGATLGNDFDAINCQEVWDNIFQQPPLLTPNIADAQDNDYFVSQNGSGVDALCHYYLIASLNTDGNGVVQDPGVSDSIGNKFTYQPATSAVVVYVND